MKRPPGIVFRCGVCIPDCVPTRSTPHVPEPRFYGLGVSDPHELNKFGGKKWRHVILLVEKLVLQSHGLAEIVFQRIRVGGLRVTRNTIHSRGEGAHHLVQLIGGTLKYQCDVCTEVRSGLHWRICGSNRCKRGCGRGRLQRSHDQ